MAEKQPSHWERFINSIDGRSSSGQLALGLTLGVLIGLLPKDSVLVIAAVIVLILTPANLLSGMIAALLVSCLGSVSWVNDTLHALGISILQNTSWNQFLNQNWPRAVVPWTRLDNSIVNGALGLWLIVAMPIYFLAWVCFERFGDRCYRAIRETKIAIWLLGSATTKLNEG